MGFQAVPTPYYDSLTKNILFGLSNMKHAEAKTQT